MSAAAGTFPAGTPGMGWGNGVCLRVGGSHRHYCDFHAKQGSIPAGAGEPDGRSYPVLRREVYPRGCEGTLRCCHVNPSNRGLSPRVRGNLAVAAADVAFRETCPSRSIPAGAGEPVAYIRAEGVPEVYPRGCGGTRGNGQPGPTGWGLSPRVRGNHGRGSDSTLESRSIPAGAGGTTGEGRIRRWSRGLSPRVRGNLECFSLRRKSRGSIPAGAGEPRICRPSPCLLGVYPRGCGGTST